MYFLLDFFFIQKNIHLAAITLVVTRLPIYMIFFFLQYQELYVQVHDYGSTDSVYAHNEV